MRLEGKLRKEMKELFDAQLMSEETTESALVWFCAISGVHDRNMRIEYYERLLQMMRKNRLNSPFQ